MAVRTYGNIEYVSSKKSWAITQAEPHVCIKLKSIFLKIGKTDTVPFYFPDTTENCHDLLWFMERYPFGISDADKKRMGKSSKDHVAYINKVEQLLMPDYVPTKVILKEPEQAREYQERAADLHKLQKRFLLGDDIGLGKTLSAILTFFNPATLPAIVVVQTHLANQWKEDQIERFTNLKAHIIKGRKPYNLPPADVYIIRYSCLSGWVDLFGQGFFKSAVFDETQELRRTDSDKYRAAKVLSGTVEYCLGMSATPIYNYGDEMFNVMNLIKPGCLGDWDAFSREWCSTFGNHYKVNDTKALGTYLRDQHLFLRRTRAEVGRELPEVNKIIHPVGYDSEEVKKADQIAYQLAIKVTQGSFMERGSAARDLDAYMRHVTGVSKAKEVAEYCKLFLENDVPIVLAGWHRDVYTIWMEQLAEYKPVLYTGSESPAAKQRSKDAFIAGETNLFIISLRSGIGLDGLQKRCRDVVFGELDWSPMVHNQVIGRVDRDGQEEPVSAYFPVSDYGSDPIMIDMLGLKASQSQGIIDPLKGIETQFTDESRIKKLAESLLKRHHERH